MERWAKMLDKKTQHHKDVSSKLNNKFNIISIEIPSVCCCLKLNKLVIKFIWQNKQAKAARKALGKSNMETLALPDVKKNYKTSKIKTVKIIAYELTIKPMGQNRKSSKKPKCIQQFSIQLKQHLKSIGKK